jgi:hypothetical protein
MRWINLSSPGVETFEGGVISTLGIIFVLLMLFWLQRHKRTCSRGVGSVDTRVRVYFGEA